MLNDFVEIIKNKMKCVVSRNPDIKIILKIAEILDGNGTSKDSLPAELTADECVYFKSRLLMLNKIFRLTNVCYSTTGAIFYLKTL